MPRCGIASATSIFSFNKSRAGTTPEVLNVTRRLDKPKPQLRPDISRALYDFSQANSLSVAASKALLPDISLSGFAGVLSLGSWADQILTLREQRAALDEPALRLF